MRLPSCDLASGHGRLPRLCGGERTRLSLARGILSGRPVLLLDEPTAHLEEVRAQRVLERLGTTGQSAVMVSHDLRPAGWTEVALGGDRVSHSANRHESSVRMADTSAPGVGAIAPATAPNERS